MSSKIWTTALAGIALVAQASIATAAAAAPVPASGVASNRAALGLPVMAVSSATAVTEQCTTTDGSIRASCDSTGTESELKSGAGIVILLAAVAAVGLGAAAAASGGDDDGGPVTPTSP